MRQESWECFLGRRLQTKQLASDPGMHHGACVTHLPWCMSGSLTRGGGKNVPGIPGACAIRNFTYLVRGPWHKLTLLALGVWPMVPWRLALPGYVRQTWPCPPSGMILTSCPFQYRATMQKYCYVFIISYNWTELFWFRTRYNWRFFLCIWLMVSQHWLGQWLGAIKQWAIRCTMCTHVASLRCNVVTH